MAQKKMNAVIPSDKSSETAADSNCSDTALMKAIEFTTILSPQKMLLNALPRDPKNVADASAPARIPTGALGAAEELRAPITPSALRMALPQSAVSPVATRTAGGARASREEYADLTEQLRLRDAALDSTTSHFMISAVDADGSKVLYVNRALCREFGYTREELIGQSPRLLTSEEQAADADRVISQALALGKGIRVRLRSRRKDGSTFTSGVTITPIRSSGVRQYSVAVGSNISSALAERETKERLQNQLVAELQERDRISMELNLARKLESVGRLASGIAHEINTPIHYVGDGVSFLKSAVADLRQLVEMYRDAIARLAQGAEPDVVQRRLAEMEAKFDKPFLDEEIPAAFERTHEGIERVASIVRAMKEFAHPDEREHSPADINRAIETTLLVASNEYKYCATVQTALGEVPAVMCNIGELNQVFLNVLVNAAHAIEAAGRDAATGVIKVSTAAFGRFVDITFEDNGCGIPNENLERIFDPFFTTKEVGKGTGQGLAIARSIVVEKHGGTIDVRSDVGIGTRLVLRLPIAGRVDGAGKR